ncbi:hypothetical protein [Hanstruepera ponticola]|uniref:hypothetical protein n=1 Tax=Hanstruepera ponticola TaxID=2042995 RepID=UPI000CF13F6F|nr:hypothetical protein [Hanstruepera ponticola]
MSNKSFKYKVSPLTVRKANQSLIKNGISDKVRNSFNGDIVVHYSIKNGIKVKTFTNKDIKNAYEKALSLYAERV